jgi:hypothetical protein
VEISETRYIKSGEVIEVRSSGPKRK